MELTAEERVVEEQLKKPQVPDNKQIGTAQEKVGQVDKNLKKQEEEDADSSDEDKEVNKEGGESDPAKKKKKKKKNKKKKKPQQNPNEPLKQG